jgi:hypothetical protein
MGWSGRAPTPPAVRWPGAPRQRARHAHHDSTACDLRSRHRYWEELVPHHRLGWPRRDRVASAVVAQPGRSPLCQYATVLGGHAGLRWGASPGIICVFAKTQQDKSWESRILKRRKIRIINDTSRTAFWPNVQADLPPHTSVLRIRALTRSITTTVTTTTMICAAVSA